MTARQQLVPGSVVTPRSLTAVLGPDVAIPDPSFLTHLQFRRFAGCPVCNLHLRSVVRQHAEIEARGVREVVVFHSPGGELREHARDLPFAVIADPGKRLYAEFGVESAPRALLDPRAWAPVLAAVGRSARAILRGRERPPAATPHGGRLGLPADFLIDGNGRIVACRYGEHAYDQWPVAEILRLAEQAPVPPATGRRGRASPAPRSASPAFRRGVRVSIRDGGPRGRRTRCLRDRRVRSSSRCPGRRRRAGLRGRGGDVPRRPGPRRSG